MPKTQVNPSVKIALDGPSALTLYRDRCDITPRTKEVPEQQNPVEIDSDGDIWLSDEDIAATLSQESVFGHSDEFAATTKEDEMQRPSLKRSSMRHLAQCASRSRDLKLVPYESLGIQPPAPESPLFLLVPKPDSRRQVMHVSQRVHTQPVPRYSFMRLQDTTYVPSPELLYVLMAHYLTLPGLMLLAMELCGHYRLVGAPSHRPLNGRRTIYNQKRLTSVRRLQSFVGESGSFSGRKDAIRALKYVVDGAASPMESAVYLLLCLPRALGGYGFRRPILNAKRPVSERAGKLTMANHLIPDLYWPEQQLDLEYDSDEFHSGLESLTAGARRTMALRLMKVEVVSLTYDIVCDEDAFDATARLVARKLGQRFYVAKDRTAQARKELRDALLRQTDIYKPRLEHFVRSQSLPDE